MIIRGGGSLEDLAAFNSELVVRSIVASRIPTVCGVGHERDESLADLAADVRASTPSNAAEIVVPERREILSEPEFSFERMKNNLLHIISHQRRIVAEQHLAIKNRLRAEHASAVDLVANAERLFVNLDPRRILKRGYSLVMTEAGSIVRSQDDVDIGQNLVVELAKGALAVRVLKK